MYRILYEELAEEDLRAFRAFEARRILDEVDAQLTREPMKPTHRRKRLEGLVPPWDSVRPVWQLRVGEFRVFYDVDERRREVIVRAVRRKGTRSTEEIL
ncbi:MAG TPA: type II toxin-antitoxin system RelE/ParE family toxin [Myxococcales bacterium]|jgi:mRNA-degrading endonuclease RelE of RelBE toxin-antitoxin system|nr:type II toxin-antitoxin system RelE/ParE family toxin [Myxococcales bacterium]